MHDFGDELLDQEGCEGSALANSERKSVAAVSMEVEPGSGACPSDGASSASGLRREIPIAGVGARVSDATSSRGAAAGSGPPNASVSAGHIAGSESSGVPAARGPSPASGGPAVHAHGSADVVYEPGEDFP